MRASVAADHPFVRREVAVRRGPRDRGARRPGVQGGDPRRPRRARPRSRRAAAARDLLRARPVPATCARARTSSPRATSGRSSCSPSPAPTGAATRSAPMLQRIYGTVWETQEELDQYLWRREEAKKRDHRKLGVQLDLFSFHDVSPGAAFWHPKGWRLYQTLRDADARAPGPARLRRGLHAAARPPEAVGAVRPLGPLPGQHVSSSRSRARRSASSR